MYTKYIDQTFEYTNFTVDEQDKILVAKRSNNTLVSTAESATLDLNCVLQDWRARRACGLHRNVYCSFKNGWRDGGKIQLG